MLSSRAAGDAVISLGMRSMHSCWRHSWLAIALPSRRSAFSPASPPSSSVRCGT